MKFDVVQLESTGIDVIDGDRGKNYPHQNELLSTGFCLFLSAKNVTKSGFSFSETQFISQRKDALLNNGRLCRGDIVITTRGTVGNVALYSPQVPYENIRINSGMLIIRCANNISNQYLYQVLRSEWFQKQIMAVQSGSAQPQLPKSHFLKMNIPLPPLPIQEKITSILQLIDDKITTNNSINDNLQQQVLAMYRNKFIDTTNAERTICRADEFFDISIGKTPPRKESQWFSNNPEDVTWVSISDMGSCGLYIRKSSERLTQEAVKRFNIKVVPDNTVLLSFKLTVGRIAITNGEMTTNEAIAHFKTDCKSINEYLYCYL